MAYSGKQSFILVGQESTFNTAVSTTKDIGIITSVDTSLNNNTIDIDVIGQRQKVDILAGSFDGTISFNGILNSGAIFEMFFFQATDETNSSDYRHVFVDKDGTEVTALAPTATIKSYTISSNHDGASDVVFTYSGCVINTLNVSMEYGGTLTFDSEVIVTSAETSTSAGSRVLTSTTPLSFAQGTVKTGDEDSESQKCPISSFSLNMSNNIDPNDVRCIGNRFAIDYIPKNLTLEGDFTARFGSKDEAERFLGGSSPSTSTPDPTGIIFEVTNGVSLGSGRVGLYIKLLGCQYESLGRSYSQDGVVEESYSYKATEIDVIYFDDAVSSYF